jgi:Sec-independent protein translocase protein TatA
MGKKRPYFARTTITIPNDLKRRMDKLPEQVNWSGLACQAFQAKLAEIEAKKERAMPTNVLTGNEKEKLLKRLRPAKQAKEEAEQQERDEMGHRHGPA